MQRKLFKVTQKQGNRVITSTIEAKSFQNLMAFLKAVSTAKVSCVYEVHYEDRLTTPPIDDMNYFKQYKAILTNSAGISNQVLIHNVKLNLSENEIASLIRAHLETGGMSVDSLKCVLFKKN